MTPLALWARQTTIVFLHETGIAMTANASPRFNPLTGHYEPSAIVQLADGRFLIVEDEKEHPFSLVSLDRNGKVDSTALTPGLFEFDDGFWKLDDLEGLTLDPSGWIYAITSQSLDGKGDSKKSREKLVRFRIKGDRIVDSEVTMSLKSALLAAHPALAAAARIRDVKSGGGLNVEALEASADGLRLWVGFRGPLLDQRALVACVENPSGIFDRNEAPRIAARLETLDLGGHGIRGLSYVPSLGGYLVIAGPVGAEEAAFRLWFWSSETGAPARRVRLPGLSGIERAEGICPAVLDGRPCLVIVSDDGKRAEGRYAQYLVLDLVTSGLTIDP
jgi:hypothetical protein